MLLKQNFYLLIYWYKINEINKINYVILFILMSFLLKDIMLLNSFLMWFFFWFFLVWNALYIISLYFYKQLSFIYIIIELFIKNSFSFYWFNDWILIISIFLFLLHYLCENWKLLLLFYQFYPIKFKYFLKIRMNS